MDELEVETLDLSSPFRRQAPKPSPEVAQLQRRLLEEINARREAEAKILHSPAVARITGRLGRIDPADETGAEVIMWLIASDQRDDGDNAGRELYQAIKVRAKTAELSLATDACQLTILCRFHRGMLHLDAIEAIVDCADPLPEARLPQRKIAAANNADGKLPSMEDLNKSVNEGGWASLNHSVYRFQVPVHVTFSPKYRAKMLLGREVEAQLILRQVIEAEGVEAVAVAVENGDHVHLLLRHPGAGTPPTWCWSKFVGRIKALTSKRFKSFDTEFAWQTGFAITAVHGGRQGAETALSIVKSYVEKQVHHEDPGGGSDAE